jgi:assimilatory nitrate reductase catalytic subunit
LLERGRLLAWLSVAPCPGTLPDRWWDDVFAARRVSEPDRSRLMTVGMQSGGVVDFDPLVCACHRVARAAILRAAGQHGGCDLAEIGRITGAGTGCGSCLAEIRSMIRNAG